MLMAEKLSFTPAPWQFIYGDIYDHSEDGHANGFTVLMAGARVCDMPPDEMPEAGSAQIGRPLVIHQVRIAEDIFPEDAGRTEAEANARLISAAPELYAALNCACDLISNGYQPPDLVKQIRTALDKATGGSCVS
jgi:hypothetical protein